MKSTNYKYAPALMLLTAGAMFGYGSSAPPTGMTSAPGELDCTSCHGGSPNTGPGSVTIAFPDSNGYVGGQKYRLRVTVADPTAKRWGFEMSNRKEATNLFEGAFATVAGTNTTALQRAGNFQYISHSAAGTFQQQVTQAAWEMDWTAPVAGTGPIRFYASGNAANNNGADTGDKIYTTNLSVPEQLASTPPPAITVGNTILSQIAFGGGWYTAMYFTNQSATPVTFNVNFYNDSAVAVAVGGQTTKAVLVPAGGTSIVEAQNTGTSTTTAWATFELPAGVSGYGVFRQSVAGKSDQEAVVPYASSAGTKALLTFDETNFTTAVALWYNGAAKGNVTVTVKDESGTTLGTSTISMDPGTKVPFAIVDRVPAISGHRGSVILSTTSGSIAVLGLRFGGNAFTSIPAAPAN